MQAFARRKPRRNFGVTVQTFQGHLAAKLVATGAVRGSIQRFVRSRERSGIDLGRGDRYQQYEARHQCGNTEREGVDKAPQTETAVASFSNA